MGSGYSLKKSAREPRPPFTTNLECSIQARGGGGTTLQLSSQGQTEQSPAVAAGTLARPARCLCKKFRHCRRLPALRPSQDSEDFS